jgi:integral membrane protein
MDNKIKVLKTFKILAIAEGISFLILLLIAMPLKYTFQIPEPVKYVGWAHGVLFVLYCILLLQVFIVVKWSFFKILVAFIVSFIPFGTFWLDAKINTEINIQKEGL